MNENSLSVSLDGALLGYFFHCSLSLRTVNRVLYIHSLPSILCTYACAHIRQRSQYNRLISAPNAGVDIALENVHFHIRSFSIQFYCKTILWIDCVFCVLTISLFLSLPPVSRFLHLPSTHFIFSFYVSEAVLVQNFVKHFQCVFSSLKLLLTASGFTHKWTLHLYVANRWTESCCRQRRRQYACCFLMQ